MVKFITYENRSLPFYGIMTAKKTLSSFKSIMIDSHLERSRPEKHYGALLVEIT